MKLFIQVRNGQPWQHPILPDNLLQAFPGFDLNNPPEGFAPFVRVERPSADVMPVGNLEVAECTYQLADDGVTYKDVWSVREMTTEEKTKAIADRRALVTNDIAALSEIATNKIAETTGDIQTAWQTYLSVLQSITVTDPFAVEFPAQPRLDEYGNLVTA
jgi:hypothetical protein